MFIKAGDSGTRKGPGQKQEQEPRRAALLPRNLTGKMSQGRAAVSDWSRDKGALGAGRGSPGVAAAVAPRSQVS